MEAAGVPELRVPLAAAINLLDAACARRGTMLPVAELRAEYQLPEVQTIQAAEGRAFFLHPKGTHGVLIELLEADQRLAGE